jgi:hypothetical protein
MASEKIESRAAVAPRDNYFARQARERWMRIWHDVTQRNEKTRENYLAGIIGAPLHDEVMLPADFLSNFFAGITAEVEGDIEDSLNRYLPSEIRSELSPAPLSKIGPLDILALASDNAVGSERQKFEAARLLEMAGDYANMSIHVGKDSSKFTALQQETRVLKSPQTLRLVLFLRSLGLGLHIEIKDLVIYLSPLDKWKAKKILWKEDESPALMNDMTKRNYVRIVEKVPKIILGETPSIAAIGAAAINEPERTGKQQLEGKKITAAIYARQKGNFAAYGQRFRRIQRRFFFSNDFLGFRIACFSEEDAKEWEKFFLRMAGYRRTKRRQIGQRNEFSSPRIRLYSRAIQLAGSSWEIQFWPNIHHLYNVCYSTDDEAHELYHLRCYLDSFFPQLWPAEIYGVEWSNPFVREKCKRHVIERITAANERLRS